MRLMILIWMLAFLPAPAEALRVNAKDFEYACEYVRVFHGGECKDLPPPKVKHFKYEHPYYVLRGVYILGKTEYVYVNEMYKGKALAREVAFHESIHYILDWTDTRVTKCHSEEIARQVS